MKIGFPIFPTSEHTTVYLGGIFMKPVAYYLILLCCIVTSGCVKRTVSVSKGNSNSDGTEQMHGLQGHSKVVEEKTLWIWQKEYRNPK